MENQLTRVEVSVASGWNGDVAKFRRLLKARLAGVACEIAVECNVELNRVQVVSNPKKR